MNGSPEPVPLRRHVYTLLIAVAAAAVAARILSVNLVYEPYLHRNESDPPDGRRVWPKNRPEPMPTFSSNDRSRWATVRALVDQGTSVIGTRDPSRATSQNKYGDEGIVFEDGWGTVDKVLDPKNGRDFYSSKPPLLTVLVAGEYWLLKHLLGWSITGNRWEVVDVILLTVNWLPLLLYLALLARLVERFGTTDWGRVYVVAAACFATFVTTFATTLNNHTVAACCALYALYAALGLWKDGAVLVSGSRLNFALAGFFSGFAACLEMPAAALTGSLFLLLLVRAPARALAWFVPAAAMPAAAFFLTNYLAVGQLRPVQSEFGTAWYVYEGSHWKPPGPGEVKFGIDWAGLKETKATYAFHLLLGHHGLFSLSPIVLLAAAGMAGGLWRRQRPADWELWPGLLFGRGNRGQPRLNVIPTLTAFLSIVVVGFYIFKTDNYGGWTSGPRWLMWLTPFWLLTMLPVVDWLARRRWGRGLAYVLLAISVLSVSYPAWNPWRHPWIYNLMEAMDWIRY